MYLDGDAFVDEYKDIFSLLEEGLYVKTKPATTPTRTPSRRSKPWTIIPESIPNPEPKGEVTPISFIRFDKFTDNDVLITFDVGDVRFTETFTNTGETIETPELKKAMTSVLFANLEVNHITLKNKNKGNKRLAK